MLTIYVHLQVPLPPPSSSLFSSPLQQGPITSIATAAEAAALDPGPPVYELAKARTVSEAWREYKTGIGGGPATEELETLWQARWRPLCTFKRWQLRRDLLIGSVESQCRGDVNRNDSRICFRTGECEALECGEVQYFTTSGYVRGQWAFIKQFTRLVIDHDVGVVSYGAIGCPRYIRVEWIQSLIGILREGGVNLIVSDVN
jgi:hypothetical protein